MIGDLARTHRLRQGHVQRKSNADWVNICSELVEGGLAKYDLAGHCVLTKLTVKLKVIRRTKVNRALPETLH